MYKNNNEKECYVNMKIISNDNIITYYYILYNIQNLNVNFKS